MKYKAILSDFDNTLVSSDSIVSDKNIAAIKKLSQEGVKFSIATGRHFKGRIEDTCKLLSLNTMQIVFGGAQIIDLKNKKEVWKETIQQEIADDLIQFFTEQNIFFCIELTDQMFTPDGQGVFDMHPSYPVLPLKEYLSQDIYKMYIPASRMQFSEKTIEPMISMLIDTYKTLSITKIKWHNDGYGMDITSEKATKHTAVLEYCKLQGLDPHEVIGIGDGYNDYPLLSACGYKIAMGDAHEELKEIADFVAPSAKEEGMRMILDLILTDNLPPGKS